MVVVDLFGGLLILSRLLVGLYICLSVSAFGLGAQSMFGLVELCTGLGLWICLFVGLDLDMTHFVIYLYLPDHGSGFGLIL